jgi:MFS family permease
VSDPARVFLSWSAIWSVMFRGYGLAALIYYVVDADLEPLQLVLLGTALEVSVLLAEIPTGVVADTLSRKRSIVISHVVMGVAFVLTGLTDRLHPAPAHPGAVGDRLDVHQRRRCRLDHRRTR